MVASIFRVEPWFIGGIFFLFLLGAATTKDFADMEGDEAHGCYTLPVKYGVKKAAWMISPMRVRVNTMNSTTNIPMDTTSINTR